MFFNKAKGNMYEWCSHTHSYLRGKCPHGCTYCYVQAMCARFPNMRKRYSGPVEFDREQLKVHYDTPATRSYAKERGLKQPTIFIEHLSDLFAETAVSDIDLETLIRRCNAFENVTFVFQTKNPQRVMRFQWLFKRLTMLGTTVESDCVPASIYDAAHAPPHTSERLRMIEIAKVIGRFKTFITVEPIMRMNSPELFARAIAQSFPSFVNVGADSKGKGLIEPTREELIRFLDELDRAGVTVKRKSNLERLMK